MRFVKKIALLRAIQIATITSDFKMALINMYNEQALFFHLIAITLSNNVYVIS